jgi:hypothetical protein
VLPAWQDLTLKYSAASSETRMAFFHLQSSPVLGFTFLFLPGNVITQRYAADSSLAVSLALASDSSA